MTTHSTLKPTPSTESTDLAADVEPALAVTSDKAATHTGAQTLSPDDPTSQSPVGVSRC